MDRWLYLCKSNFRVIDEAQKSTNYQRININQEKKWQEQNQMNLQLVKKHQILH
jgi:hypothetical protein